ncbi:TPA: cell wall-binding protein Cwp20 [Clostridioides difficile]|uniref:cell wall-binding protein Cwp20 n=1 Tax=Clostridioides difficile TaxID=1496 RepID=UPI001C1D746E|nr:cell wall-binding protein Cwp20 [Clostridioides difficile]MCF2713669.1 cell wall-binding protein Cwp20 [Clostridioides difficile]MDM9884094.1 cell wall-binding protein Cwp20 [Clostridioides difficile]MDW0061264.1 cell wall-binding protein Cwp20 [Clostridioides difficile]HBE9349324.1 cell wall-binding protein Cwp20 [Clostridioides difficile]HBE9825593.1 cell wall-binding protein Cwp20 [Clostridioides difficile]
MFKQKLSKLLSSTLVLSMLFTAAPNITFADNTKDNSEKYQSSDIELHDYSKNSESYTKTKALAKEKIQTLLSKYGAVSAQYALIDNGKIEISGNGGVYSKQDNKNLNKDNMYSIASISKMFTTTAVMKLVDEGKINLDTPVVNYIPEFKMADDRYKEITPRMLLNHSSGLMGSSFKNTILLGDNDSYGHDNFLKELQKQRLKAKPGAFSVYCNDGFTLAEILVERVSGMSFTNFLDKYINNPLNLQNTKTPENSFDSSKLAKAYVPYWEDAVPQDNLNAIGAGGLYSSAENLCTFAQTFMKNSNGILSPASVKAMENKEYLNGLWPEGEDSILGYGLGWDCVNTYPFNQYNLKALTKGGDSLLFHSNLIVLPDENMAVAVLSSGGSSQLNEIIGQEILLSALKEKGKIKEIKPDKTFSKPQQVKMPSSLKENSGLYASSNMIKVDVNDNGTLTVSSPYIENGPEDKYVYIGQDRFVSEKGNSCLKFVKEKNNITYLNMSSYDDVPGLGQTASLYYVAQKVDDNNISNSVKEVWKKRNGKGYYLVDEKYTSQSYMFGSVKATLGLSDETPGYIVNTKIIDENNSNAFIEIPGVIGRDLSDIKLHKENGTEYLSFGTLTYVSEDSITNLPAEKSFTCELASNGYAKWYKIGDDIANKKIEVNLPQNSSFAVYDDKGVPVNYSLVTKNNRVRLPKGGVIVFLGSPNARFEVTYQDEVNASALTGTDRYETSIKISQAGWETAENAVLINDSAIADALAATPFAYKKNAPILLTGSSQINEKTLAELKRLKVKNVYVVGGEASINEKSLDTIKSNNISVSRISGSDRYQTSMNIAKELNNISNISKISVVNGEKGLADAVSIGAVSAQNDMPIILTNENSNITEINNLFKNKKIDKSYVIGGKYTVSKNIENKLQNPQRISGSTRNETNAKVIKEFYKDSKIDNLYVAKNGMNKQDDLIDGLSVGVLAGKTKSPVMLVGNSLDYNQKELFKTMRFKSVTQIGGNGNENSFKQIKDIA